MTISYNAGTNLITLTGDGVNPAGGTAWGNAYDMEDVLTACGAVVTKQGANAYDVSARMIFDSNVYFVSKSEFVELKPNPTNCVYTIRIEAGSHVKFGDYNVTDKYSFDGAFWRIYLASTTGHQTSTGNRILGEFLCYGSSVWTDSNNFTRGPHFVAGSTVRLFNSTFKYAGYFWAADCDVQDVKWHGGGGSYDMLVAVGPDFNWANLTTMGCNYGVFFSGTTTADVDAYAVTVLNSTNRDIFLSTGCHWLIRVINPTANPTVTATGSNQPGCQVCYTFNIKVTNDQGSPIVGAMVSLKNNEGNDAFTPLQTIAGGVLPSDKIIIRYWYRNANMGGNKDYNDHTLKVVNGADEAEYKIKIDHQITEDVVLLPQSVASYDNIMAAITDIKGTGFVKDTDSLVDIRPETDKIQGVKTKTDNLPSAPADDATVAKEVELLMVKKSLYNKKILEKVSDAEYTETLYDDNKVDVVRVFSHTKSSDTETRDPIV